MLVSLRRAVPIRYQGTMLGQCLVCLSGRFITPRIFSTVCVLLCGVMSSTHDSLISLRGNLSRFAERGSGLHQTRELENIIIRECSCRRKSMYCDLLVRAESCMSISRAICLRSYLSYYIPLTIVIYRCGTRRSSVICSAVSVLSWVSNCR